MNAPTSAAALKPTIQMIALGALVPSSTHIQEMRRARFDLKAIDELAVSIRAVGVLQPILVRLSQAAGRADRYEIVAGERRWLASKKAGAAEIPASVRELADEQVLEVQLIENLQRTDLHELEEAEGYEELMKLKGISADTVADMVGRSKSYVFKRAKLLALCPEARKAFYAGELDASTALLIARIPGVEFQKKAMKDLAQQKEWGDVKNFKEASDFLRDNFMLRLKEAPFDRGDAALVAGAGSCLDCPKRTGNQKDLFGDVKDAELCTDAKCFDEKREAHFARVAKRVEASGKKIIYGAAAKKVLPDWRDNSGFYMKSGDYIALDEYHPELGGKLKQAMPQDFEPTLLQHPGTGKVIEVAPKTAVTKAKLLKKVKGRPSSSGAYNYDAAQKRAKAKGPDVDEMLTDRLAMLIKEKAPKTFTKSWYIALAEAMFERLNFRDLDAVAKAWGWPTKAFKTGSYSKRLAEQAGKLDERELMLLMFHLNFAVGQWQRDDVLELFGIDEDKTRDLIIEERKKARQTEKDQKVAKKAKASKK